MTGKSFAPRHKLTVAQVESLFAPPPAMAALGARAVHADSFAPGHEPDKAIDGDPVTIWHTPWTPDAPTYPHEIQIELGREVTVKGFTYLPRQDMQNGWISRYRVFVGSNRSNWGAPAAEGEFPHGNDAKTIVFDRPVRGRFFRFVAVEGIGGQKFASVADLDILADQH